MTDPITLAHVVGTTDIVASFFMAWSFLKITTAAGFGTTWARWALFRRFVYACLTVSLFALGAGRLGNDFPVDAYEATWQLMLTFGVMIFPLLRAMGWITQDSFQMVDGSTRHKH